MGVLVVKTAGPRATGPPIIFLKGERTGGKHSGSTVGEALSASIGRSIITCRGQVSFNVLQALGNTRNMRNNSKRKDRKHVGVPW